MIGKVYLRKKVVVPQLIQVQESEPTSRNEVTVFHPPLQIESKLQFEKLIDQNLPIAIRKGTRECTKRSFYPLSHVVSFEKLSPFHKSFLTSLHNSYISVKGQLCCPFFPYFSPQAVHTSFLNLTHPSFLILAHNCFLISPFIILYS